MTIWDKLKHTVNTAKAGVREFLRSWLGIDDMEADVVIAGDLARIADDSFRQLSYWLRETPGVDGIAADVHLGERWGGRADSLVIICSRLRGGMVRFFPIRVGSFADLQSFIRMTESLLEPDIYFWDAPRGLNEMLKDEVLRKEPRRWRDD